MSKKSLKWSPAVPIRRPDTIPSSKARTRGDFGFKPSYLSEKTENMNHIMSNEYMRKWFAERDYYQRELFIKIQTQMEERNMKRRYVQRMLMREKREKVLPIIQLKRFQNISSKIDTIKEEEKKDETKGKAEGDGTKEKEATKLPRPAAKVEAKIEIPYYQRYKPECYPKGKKKKNLTGSSEANQSSQSTATNKLEQKPAGQSSGLNEEPRTKMPNSFASEDVQNVQVGLMIPHCRCKCRFKMGADK